MDLLSQEFYSTRKKVKIVSFTIDLRHLNCSCQILVAYNLLGVCKQLQFSSLLKKEETMVFLMV